MQSAVLLHQGGDGKERLPAGRGRAGRRVPRAGLRHGGGRPHTGTGGEPRPLAHTGSILIVIRRIVILRIFLGEFSADGQRAIDCALEALLTKIIQFYLVIVYVY